MNYDKYLKSAIIGLFAIFLYTLLNGLKGLPFYIVGVDINNVSQNVKIFYLIMYDLFMIATFGLIFNKELIKDAKDMKKNHKKYFSETFKLYLIGVVIMILSNIVIMLLTNKGLSTNEILVRKLFKASPIYMYLSSIIFAPFVEEIVFRGELRKIISNKYLFTLISGLIFAYIHVSNGDLLHLIPYSSLGIFFAYAYTKTENIFTSMGFHIMHNGILISLQFIPLLYGNI